MPQIRSVNLDNGIFIETTGGLSNINILTSQFPSVDSAEELSETLTSTCQRAVEITQRLNTFSIDDPVRQHPPILGPNERISGGDLIITNLYIAVHVFSYPIQSQSDYTVMCSDSLIGGDWWL